MQIITYIILYDTFWTICLRTMHMIYHKTNKNTPCEKGYARLSLGVIIPPYMAQSYSVYAVLTIVGWPDDTIVGWPDDTIVGWDTTIGAPAVPTICTCPPCCALNWSILDVTK